jgi:heme-degrading monooxygenase HmoA
MVDSAFSPNPQRLYRIDKFKVPQSARVEFLEQVRTTHELLRTLPGFVRDALFEQSSGPGAFNFVTLVEWENAEALEGAKQVIMAKHADSEFNPPEMFARLGIDADLANYVQFEA